MARTRRAQILMEPAEYAALERIAARRGVSVGELFRRAVRAQYLEGADERRAAWERLLALDIDCDFGAPSDLARELEDAHDAGLP